MAVGESKGRAVRFLVLPNLRLHLIRLSCPVMELAGPAAEVCHGSLSPSRQPVGIKTIHANIEILSSRRFVGRRASG